MSLSKIVISGTVTTNPEKRFTQNDIPIVSFAIDINPQDSSVVRVVKFGSSAEHLADEIVAGDTVIVDGRPQTASYTDENGKERKTIEINASTVEKISIEGSVSRQPVAATVKAQTQNDKEIVQFAQNDNVENLIDEEEIPF